MNFKTPSFWYKKRGVISYLLSPLSLLYKCGRNIHVAISKEKKSPVNVICVGNITAGGSGKTPVALGIMKLVKEHNIAKSPYFLTRGYKGGDESIILRKEAETIVSADRHKGIMEAYDKGADLIIMDDGFQNPSIEKNFSFVVVDSKYCFGNEMLMPAGPLREDLSKGMDRADAFIIIGNNDCDIETKKPVFRAFIKPVAPPSKDFKYMAFCGIGLPDKFFNFLESEGYNVVTKIPFPDHYDYSDSDMTKLIQDAEADGLNIITTEKDYVKIPDKYKGRNLCYIPIVIEFENNDKMIDLLKNSIVKMET